MSSLGQFPQEQLVKAFAEKSLSFVDTLGVVPAAVGSSLGNAINNFWNIPINKKTLISERG